jgi:hypothetical protein
VGKRLSRHSQEPSNIEVRLANMAVASALFDYMRGC